MKRISLIILALMTFFYSKAQQEKAHQLKFNSCGIDFYFNNNLTSEPYATDIKSYYKNENEFINVLSMDSLKKQYKETSTIGYSSFSISAGFTPFSKKKDEFNTRQEIVFGGSFLNMYYPYNDIHFISQSAITDTINEYSISQQTGDTIQSKKYYRKFIEEQNESYFYSGKRMVIFTEWFFKTNPDKKINLSIAPGFRLSYIYKANIQHNYFVSSKTGYVDDVNSVYLRDDVYLSNYTLINKTHQAKGGFILEPYLKAKIEMKLSMKDNFLNHFSINVNSYLGSTFNMIFSTKTVTQLLYGGGVGLKYSI